MHFAALLTDLQLILLGLAVLVIAFVLYRGIALSQRSGRRDFAAEARAELNRTERAAASGIEKLEVRLHDYGREIEGRVATTRTMLDRLILDAEQEARRLSELLKQSRPIAQSETLRKLTSDEHEMLRELQRAGYGIDRLARLLGRPTEEIIAALQETHESQRSGAA